MNHAGGGGSINRSTEPAESICLLQLSRKCPSRAATPMDTVLQNHGSAQSGSALCKAQPGKAIEGRARSPFSASSPSESQSHLHIHSCSCGDRKSDRLSLGKMVALMSSSATVLKTFRSELPFPLFVPTLSQPRTYSSIPRWLDSDRLACKFFVWVRVNDRLLHPRAIDIIGPPHPAVPLHTPKTISYQLPSFRVPPTCCGQRIPYLTTYTGGHESAIWIYSQTGILF